MKAACLRVSGNLVNLYSGAMEERCFMFHNGRHTFVCVPLIFSTKDDKSGATRIKGFPCKSDFHRALSCKVTTVRTSSIFRLYFINAVYFYTEQRNGYVKFVVKKNKNKEGKKIKQREKKSNAKMMLKDYSFWMLPL